MTGFSVKKLRVRKGDSKEEAEFISWRVAGKPL